MSVLINDEFGDDVPACDIVEMRVLPGRVYCITHEVGFSHIQSCPGEGSLNG